MEDLPDLDYDLPFDEDGEHIRTHELSASFATIDQHYNLTDNYLVNTWQIINSIKQPRASAVTPADKESLTPKLGWLSWDIIQNTLDRTTQFYRTPKSTDLKKMYKSPYPACNVQR